MIFAFDVDCIEIFLQRPTDQSLDTHLTSAQIFAAVNDIIGERAWD